MRRGRRLRSDTSPSTPGALGAGVVYIGVYHALGEFTWLGFWLAFLSMIIIDALIGIHPVEVPKTKTTTEFAPKDDGK